MSAAREVEKRRRTAAMGKSGLQGYLTSTQDALLRGFWQVRGWEQAFVGNVRRKDQRRVGSGLDWYRIAIEVFSHQSCLSSSRRFFAASAGTLE